MRAFEANFVAAADHENEFPNLNLPEVAFAGRSNVGKSSLLNSIINRKNLARTSSSPGKTQTINFYVVDDKWSLVDLPGFGYASISKKTRSYWELLIFIYFESRKDLKFVCCLIDSRHDPQPKDLALLEWLVNNGKRFIVILTKCDKITEKAIQERREQLLNLLAQCDGLMDVLAYSSETNLGKKDLIGMLNKYLVR
jgi:GTP-binding protein